MELKRIAIGKHIQTLGQFIEASKKSKEIRAYDSEKKNKAIKITRTSKEKYIQVVSAYHHDNFIAVYARKTPHDCFRKRTSQNDNCFLSKRRGHQND